jgi:energy-coupling factor transporter ATP-binding protein EcfA2
MDYSKYLKSLDKTVNYDNIDPLQKDNHNIWLIVGKKGSGKSTFVLNLLRKKEMYRRHFNNIFLVSPTAQRDDKFQKLCDELKQTNNCFDECTPDILNDIRERIETFNDEFLQDEKNKKKGKKPHNLLILDDCISDLNKGSEIKNIINKMVMNSRHLKLSIWIISQKYKLISTAIRANADLITFFKNENDIEKKALEEFSIDTSLLDQLEKPSDFMHVVTRGQPKYFINLKPVLSIKDTKANNKPLDKAHGGYVRGDLKNDNDSVLCILQTGEIVLPRKVIDDKLINFLEKEKGYDKKNGEFK